MTLSELRSLARTKLRDTTPPYFWSDQWLDTCINEAIEEAVDRALLLQSTETVPVEIGEPTIAINRFVLAIEGPATFIGSDNQAHILPYITPAQFRSYVGVDLSATDTPQYFCSGELADTITVHPIPNMAGSIIVPIRRGAEASDLLVSSTDVPTIPERYHRRLVDWVLAKCFDIPDADFGDPKAAEAAEERFDKSFGRRKGARYSQAVSSGLANRRATQPDVLGFQG